MGIIDKLKKGKKKESVLDSLVKKKEPEEEAKDKIQGKPDDIEVRELPDTSRPSASEVSEDVMDITQLEAKPIREFRTEGMHEFDIDSLGIGSDANIKAEYKSKIAKLIDKNNIDAAINLLQELKQKLAEQK